MTPHLAERIASQHQAEVRRISAGCSAARRARRARQAGQARPRPHRVRQRAGWALVSLGLRIAYTTGED